MATEHIATAIRPIRTTDDRRWGSAAGRRRVERGRDERVRDERVRDEA
ncbi:hypothetical protein [Gordonia sputi]|nr:hypothetical protein [Gordonia sputi]MCM3896208.1 hypothetical protein [Gordonia sputi]